MAISGVSGTANSITVLSSDQLQQVLTEVAELVKNSTNGQVRLIASFSQWSSSLKVSTTSIGLSIQTTSQEIRTISVTLAGYRELITTISYAITNYLPEGTDDEKLIPISTANYIARDQALDQDQKWVRAIQNRDLLVNASILRPEQIIQQGTPPQLFVKAKDLRDAKSELQTRINSLEIQLTNATNVNESIQMIFKQIADNAESAITSISKLLTEQKDVLKNVFNL